jgi:hypothetical protein
MPSESPEARAIFAANQLLSGRIGALEAVRLLLPLLHQDSTIVSQSDFNSIRGIDSETDHLPIGRVREEWHPEYLPEKDREIARCEGFYRDRVRAVCERILQRYQRIR